MGACPLLLTHDAIGLFAVETRRTEPVPERRVEAWTVC